MIEGKDNRSPYLKFTDRIFYFLILCLPFERAFVQGQSGAFLQYFVIAFAILTIPLWRAYYAKWNKGVWMLFVFLTIGTCSDFFTASRLHLPFFSLSIRVWIVFYFMLVAYNMVLRSVKNQQRIIQCLLTMSIVIAIFQVLGIGTHEFTESGIGGSRSEVLGADMNQTSRDVAVFLIYGFLLFLSGNKVAGLKKWFLIALSSLSFVALIKTGSRGGLVALICTLPLAVFTTKNLSKKIACTVIVAMMLCVVGIVVLNTPVLRDRLENSIYQGDTGGREAIFNITMYYWSQAKFLGHGCFGHMFLMGPEFGWPSLATHCTYTYALVAAGIFGATFYYAFLVFILYRASRTRFEPDGAFLLLSVSMVLLGGITLNVEFSKWLYVVYGLILAVSERRGDMWRALPFEEPNYKFI